MKRKLILLLLAAVVVACSPRMVGTVNMISTRNVDSGANYQLLKTGVNDSRLGFSRIKAENIDKAINNTVLSVPGGEFVKNAKIYTDGKAWAVVGDVWGVAENANVEGFKIGDAVLIRNSLVSSAIAGERFTRAEIIGFKDKKSCLVKLPGGEIKEVNFTDLSKAEN